MVNWPMPLLHTHAQLKSRFTATARLIVSLLTLLFVATAAPAQNRALKLDGSGSYVELPPGIELASHPGERRVTGRAALAGGDNALPLTLVARGGSGGQLAARLKRHDDQKVFVVDVTVVQP